MCCSRRKIYLIGLLLIFLYSPPGVEAQSVAERAVELEIRESSVNSRVISHILKITNTSEHLFSGTLLLDSLSDLRSLSQDKREISVAPHDSLFVAYRLVVGRDIAAGRKNISYILFDDKEQKILSQEAYVDVEEREQIFLLVDDAPVMVPLAGDSVRIHVTVNNSGNTYQEVTLVFNIPNLREAPIFTEKRIMMAPMEQKRFVHSFIPSSNLLSSAQFTVHITAMKGKEKTIFGSKTVNVQNVFTDRRYMEANPAFGLYLGQGSVDNSVTLSYRQYNNSSNMLQLQGGGYLNLPAGYLHLKGNIYQYNSLQTPMITNTALMYKLNENEVAIGNISEQTELPLFGRGARVMLSNDDQGKRLTFGAIDQHFDLIGSQPWFVDYYSFYVQGELGANNSDRGVKATYIYQNNPYERAIYNVGGLQWRSPLGKNWRVDLQAHGAMGNYEDMPESRFSSSAELHYSGNLSSGWVLDGSAYYSDGYFPGSRKGTLSLTQSVSKRVYENSYLSGSIGYNRTAPKSYAYSYTYRSENSYANLMLSMPQLGRILSSLYYRHQGESSPSYSSWLDGGNSSGNLSMASHRMGWQWRWQSINSRHSLFGTLEGGFFADPLGGGRQGQAKGVLNYSYRGIMVETSYQKGAYYLYEYMMAEQQDKEFNRFSSSLSFNQHISKKLSLSSGVNFSRDIYQGNVPSVNLAANFAAKENMTLFMNAYWYRYSFFNNNNIFNVQVGMTWNFNKVQPMKGRKSKMITQVYYDHNANNCYDEGDEPADGYLLNIDNKAFVSDKNGNVRYSHVPYGDYTVKPMRVGRWFFDLKHIAVNSTRTMVSIPLKQNGTLRGSIHYVIDGQSVEIVPRYEGIRFTIKDVDGVNIQTVVTGADGKFSTFLPTGSYTITLDKKTLQEYTDCKEATFTFKIEAGKTAALAPFSIEVKERKVNMKHFFAAE